MDYAYNYKYIYYHILLNNIIISLMHFLCSGELGVRLFPGWECEAFSGEVLYYRKAYSQKLMKCRRHKLWPS